VDGNTYKLNLFLVCDMKCLVRILGLYDVFHPKSTYKCAWCPITHQDLANFDIPGWKFRDLQKQNENIQKFENNNPSDRKRGTFAKDNEGVKVK
jgi:hypothetical protein